MSGHDVSVRARFERFPATVKGAFVIHGEDVNPHQVALLEARVVSLGNQAGIVVPMAEAIVNCPPRQDMFVPFEFSLTELAPGWYELECDVTVDGAPRTILGGKRFVIHWPRSTTRRGSIPIGQDLADDIRLVQADCATDRLTVRYQAPAASALRIVADGQRLPELGASFEDGTGTVECYPLLRVHTTVRIEGGRKGAAVELALP